MFDYKTVRPSLRRLRDEPLDTASWLSENVGPRRQTSLGEAQAAAYIDGRLRRAGLHVSADAFLAPTWNGWDGTIVAALGLIGIVLYRWYPYPSVGLAIWSLALAAWRSTRPRDPLLVQRRPSQNVVGNQAGLESPRWRVVLVAPLDSLPVMHRVAQALADGDRLLVGRVIAGALIVVSGVCGLLAVDLDLQRLCWYAQFVPGAYLVAAALIDLWQWRGPVSAGAVNHGGALAVLLASAEELSAPQQIELWTVGLGATLSGVGLDDLLRRYPFEPGKTLFLVLEGLGSGALAYMTREGWLRQRAADPLLLQAAAAADAADPLIDAEPRTSRHSSPVARALRRQGWRALTFACLDPDGQPAYRASADDTPAVLSPETLERAVRLVVGVLRQIDRLEKG